MEASSHGIDQRRLDGVRLDAAGFTNLGRDHLDYHATTEAYAAAKLRLFDTLLPGDAPAVINADGALCGRVPAGRAPPRPEASHHRQHGRDLAPRRSARRRLRAGADRRGVRDERSATTLPLLGAFQVENALVAAGLVLAVEGEGRAAEVLEGFKISRACPAVWSRWARSDGAHLHRRLCPQARCARPCARCPASLRDGTAVLRRSAAAATGIAASVRSWDASPHDKADVVIVTDDNPRSEDPAAIRAEVLAAAPGAREIGDRARGHPHRRQRASRRAMFWSWPAKVMKRAKSSATGPCRSRTTTRSGRPSRRGRDEFAPLDTRRDRSRHRRARSAAASRRRRRVSIDTRTLEPGDLYFAIKGDVHDGHDFVDGRPGQGRVAPLSCREAKAASLRRRPTGSIVVPDVLEAMRQTRAAPRARARMRRSSRSPARSARPARRRPCASRLSRQGATHASVASYNNHWGVPLTLARMPRETEFGVFEIGMNHAARDPAADRHGPPACGGDHHHRAGPYRVLPLALGHRRCQGRDFFRARARRHGDRSAATTLISSACAPMPTPPRAGRVVTFGEHEAADIRAHRIIVKPDHSDRRRHDLRPAPDLQDRHGRAGTSRSIRSSVLAAVPRSRRRSRAGGARRFAELKPPVGRGERTMLVHRRRRGSADRRELQRQSGLHARGARQSRRGRTRPRRPAHRRAGRHEGTGRDGAAPARGAGGSDRGEQDRPASSRPAP